MTPNTKLQFGIILKAIATIGTELIGEAVQEEKPAEPISPPETPAAPAKKRGRPSGSTQSTTTGILTAERFSELVVQIQKESDAPVAQCREAITKFGEDYDAALESLRVQGTPQKASIPAEHAAAPEGMTIEALRALINEPIKAGDGEAVKALIVKHGGSKLSDIPAAAHAAFAKDVEALTY